MSPGLVGGCLPTRRCRSLQPCAPQLTRPCRTCYFSKLNFSHVDCDVDGDVDGDIDGDVDGGVTIDAILCTDCISIRTSSVKTDGFYEMPTALPNPSTFPVFSSTCVFYEKRYWDSGISFFCFSIFPFPPPSLSRRWKIPENLPYCFEVQTVLRLPRVQFTLYFRRNTCYSPLTTRTHSRTHLLVAKYIIICSMELCASPCLKRRLWYESSQQNFSMFCSSRSRPPRRFVVPRTTGIISIGAEVSSRRE